MKKIIHILFTTILFCLVSCQKETDKMQAYAENFFKQYPEATLQDIYKGSFQDVFGPAHMLTDHDTVKRYIIRELEGADVLEGAYYEPCGWQGNFYRINLKAIKDQKITADELTDAFMASANGIDTTLTQTFITEWLQFQQIIRKTIPSLQNFTEDSTLLAKLLEEGNYVVHHSHAFNEHYHPHYRIIRKDIFEEKILPKLK